jgi:hypothetical protein
VVPGPRKREFGLYLVIHGLSPHSLKVLKGSNPARVGPAENPCEVRGGPADEKVRTPAALEASVGGSDPIGAGWGHLFGANMKGPRRTGGALFMS